MWKRGRTCPLMWPFQKRTQPRRPPPVRLPSHAQAAAGRVQLANELKTARERCRRTLSAAPARHTPPREVSVSAASHEKGSRRPREPFGSSWQRRDLVVAPRAGVAVHAASASTPHLSPSLPSLPCKPPSVEAATAASSRSIRSTALSGALQPPQFKPFKLRSLERHEAYASAFHQKLEAQQRQEEVGARRSPRYGGGGWASARGGTGSGGL